MILHFIYRLIQILCFFYTPHNLTRNMQIDLCIINLPFVVMMRVHPHINLGFLNLLPIPILDGGHLLFYLIEAIRRRPLSQRGREIASGIGFLILGMLMLIAVRNDIMRIWFN